jgi:hypothetical protein
LIARSKRIVAMKEGTYFRIPEGPADIDRLWQDGTPVPAADLPDRLHAEHPDSYRALGTAVWPDPDPLRLKGFLAEIDELRTTGVVVDQERPGHDYRFYLLEPNKAWYNVAVFSIGIFIGDSPLRLRPMPGFPNPILTHKNVTDVPAAFVADPFLLRVDKTWNLFFEVMNWKRTLGEIGLATSTDGVRWQYQQIVLAEPFHLSYPYVFEWEGEIYMIPETYQAGAVRLYRAEDFPRRWSFLGDLLTGPYLVDPSVFRFADRWWMFLDTSPAQNHDTLRLFHADHLTGPWVEHPRSPLITGDQYTARPAGRPLVVGGKVLRFTQTCLPYYGTQVRAFEVDELTPTGYHEHEVEESPILKPSGEGWNACGMHHVDAHLLEDGLWYAAVDGWYGEEILKQGAGE